MMDNTVVPATLAHLLIGSVLALTSAVPLAHAQDDGQSVVRPEGCRIRSRGNIQDSGAFSFWDNGLLGDWFMAAAGGEVTLSVVASGKTIGQEAPTAAVELIGLDGAPREVGRLPITSSSPEPHEFTLPPPGEFFGLQLRHTNRRAGEGNQNLRHLVVQEIRVRGARRSPVALAEYAFFGAEPRDRSLPRAEATLTAETANLKLLVDTVLGVWSLEHKPGGGALQGVRPAIHIRGLPVHLGDYEVAEETRERVDHPLGLVTEVKLTYRKDGELSVEYTLLLSSDGHELIARLSFTNETGREIVVGRAAPIVVSGFSLGGNVADWAIIGDAKANSHPYETVGGGELNQLESWWYTAAKNLDTGRSVVLGSLTNNKGLGRFLLLPDSDTSLRAAAYSDYEGCTMPPAARIDGEWMLVHFGERGTDGLERFGDLIARAHGIDLRQQHPLDPYTPEGVDLFNTWNGYGSAVVKGFEYKHNREKGPQAFMDPEWTKANRQKLLELGLQHFGYARTGPVNRQGLGTPLARRYGQPDFWFKAAETISQEHPEFYLNGRIDFSNPAVIEFERERIRQAYEGKTAVLSYALDFTNDWQKLPGQHDPFMTSAETYRTVMGLWREAGKAHPQPVYCFIWMNVVGINYDMVDVIHIGHDSDQGYGGPGLTFTHGLTRQISGRYFLNGRVWWNSPDSYHAYCGGIYSYNQAKVHASFCSLSGNLVHLGEPLSDEEIPEDRLDIIRRVAPTTPDVARAVDVFEHNPARLWDMRIERPFGEWHVVGLFNVDHDGKGQPVAEEVSFEDLDLSSEQEYLVYEFWSRQFLGAMKGSFTRTLQAPDCEVYSIVEKQDHPVLMSTSRHVRQMAYDILDLEWDDAADALSGVSKLAQDDPYELRIYIPDEYELFEVRTQVPDVDAELDRPVLKIKFAAPESRDVEWDIRFTRTG